MSPLCKVIATFFLPIMCLEFQDTPMLTSLWEATKDKDNAAIDQLMNTTERTFLAITARSTDGRGLPWWGFEFQNAYVLGRILAHGGNIESAAKDTYGHVAYQLCTSDPHCSKDGLVETAKQLSSEIQNKFGYLGQLGIKYGCKVGKDPTPLSDNEACLQKVEELMRIGVDFKLLVDRKNVDLLASFWEVTEKNSYKWPHPESNKLRLASILAKEVSTGALTMSKWSAIAGGLYCFLAEMPKQDLPTSTIDVVTYLVQNGLKCAGEGKKVSGVVSVLSGLGAMLGLYRGTIKVMVQLDIVEIGFQQWNSWQGILDYSEL